MAVKYLHDMVLYIKGKQVKSKQVNMEWRIQYKNGCIQEVRREGQILVPQLFPP